MKKIWQSLYWRISFILMLLLVLVGLSYVLISVKSSREYFAETTQRLNSHVAEHMLLEVNPFVDGEVNKEALGVIMHSMMAVNPGIEVYVLDPVGNILSFVVLDKKVKLEAVDLAPVEKFLREDGEAYILGDDPRNPGDKTIFSATKITENGQHLGYVYIVLASELYESVNQTLAESFILNLAVESFSITLIAALVIALLAIYLLTRNLRAIIRGVRAFKEGDLKTRINVSTKGELGQLAETFNSMADTIDQNIEDLKQVDNLRRELIANVSHDLRTPLSVIHGYVETIQIKGDDLNEEQRAKYLDIVLRNTTKLNALVGDLFQLSKLEAKQVELHLEAFSLNELLQDISQRYALIAKEKEIDFVWEQSDQVALVEADLALIERVLQNLIDNALKFTPKGGEVRVNMQVKKGQVEVAVENSGSYIEQEAIPSLFDRYFKGRKENKESTGLGLAIVKNILDLHKSIIRVSSDREVGTSFVFDLPLRS